MCKFCLQHGVNGKWYLNARNYLNKESERFEDTKDYLEVLWGNLERIYFGKTLGMSINNTISYKLKIPIIGKVIQGIINRKLSKVKNPNPIIAEGHFGQVIPLEEAKLITMELADTVVKATCPCRYMQGACGPLPVQPGRCR